MEPSIGGVPGLPASTGQKNQKIKKSQNHKFEKLARRETAGGRPAGDDDDENDDADVVAGVVLMLMAMKMIIVAPGRQPRCARR